MPLLLHSPSPPEQPNKLLVKDAKLTKIASPKCAMSGLLFTLAFTPIPSLVDLLAITAILTRGVFPTMTALAASQSAKVACAATYSCRTEMTSFSEVTDLTVHLNFSKKGVRITD